MAENILSFLYCSNNLTYFRLAQKKSIRTGQHGDMPCIPTFVSNIVHFDIILPDTDSECQIRYAIFSDMFRLDYNEINELRLLRCPHKTYTT